MNRATHKHHWYFYVGIVLGVIILLLAGLVGWLTAVEWKPEPVEPAVMGNSPFRPTEKYQGQDLKILTWNTGYAGLGREADFVLDGGKTANPESLEVVRKNLNGISDFLAEADPDILLLQEVDMDSQRTYHINQWEEYGVLPLDDRDTAFAANYVCPFVPFPPTDPIGSVNSGIATFSRFHMGQCTRESLPVPFTWPMRIANLKRCLLVSRLPMEGSDKELVMVNLHLEAYDDGEGKIAQTRQLVELLEQEYEKGNYVIAGGDFNQVFPGAKHEVKDTSTWVPGRLDALDNGWDYLFDDSTPTCRLLNQPLDLDDPKTQFYTIDGFIVSPNVEVTSVKTLDAKFNFSDHNPVELQVKLK